jgi:serine phosphatase RsbU (regulator of sigma subunit)
VLRDEATRPPREVIDRVLAAIDRFAGNAPQFDDITLLVVKRL